MSIFEEYGALNAGLKKIFQQGLSGHNFIGDGTSLRIVGKSSISKN